MNKKAFIIKVSLHYVITEKMIKLNYINDFRLRYFGIKVPYDLMSPSDTFLEDEIFKTVSDDDDRF